jgi:hypothetical protein
MYSLLGVSNSFTKGDFQEDFLGLAGVLGASCIKAGAIEIHKMLYKTTIY